MGSITAVASNTNVTDLHTHTHLIKTYIHRHTPFRLPTVVSIKEQEAQKCTGQEKEKDEQQRMGRKKEKESVFNNSHQMMQCSSRHLDFLT